MTLTLIASRNSVVSSSSDGNDAKSSARWMYIVAITITSPTVMLTAMKRSSSAGGSGTSIITTTSTTASAPARSLCFSSRSPNPSTALAPLARDAAAELRERHGSARQGRRSTGTTWA